MRSLVVLLLSAVTPAIAEQPLVFHDVTVIDVAAGQPRPGRSVVVTGSTITAVEPAIGFTPPAGATVIDGSGKFLLPGLWDAHAHVADDSYFGLFLSNGVTAVRELHNFFPDTVLRWRDDIASGKRPGPRMLVAGVLIDGSTPIWPGSLSATTPDEGRAAVRALKAKRVDLIKVYESLRPQVYRAIVAEAAAVGLPVDGHVPQLVSAAEASDRKQRTIEHLRGVALASSLDEAKLRAELAEAMPSWKRFDYRMAARQTEKARDTFDARKEQSLFDRFKTNRTWHCPTLVVLRFMSRMDDPTFVADERLKYLSPFMTARWKPEVVLADLPKRKPLPGEKMWFERDRGMVTRLHAAGVGLLAGTDCTNPYCFPGFSLHDELELLVGCGLTPAEALRTATLNPATAFGLTDTLGTVAVGKTADLLLLDADPLVDITHTKRLAGVVANGRYFSKADADAMLAKAAGRNAK